MLCHRLPEEPAGCHQLPGALGPLLKRHQDSKHCRVLGRGGSAARSVPWMGGEGLGAGPRAGWRTLLETQGDLEMNGAQCPGGESAQRAKALSTCLAVAGGLRVTGLSTEERALDLWGRTALIHGLQGGNRNNELMRAGRSWGEITVSRVQVAWGRMLGKSTQCAPPLPLPWCLPSHWALALETAGSWCVGPG